VLIHPPRYDWGNRMYFEQFYLDCLAHASYLLGSEGEGIVVDPQRDVEIYLAAADRHGLTIRHIFETHLHADFVSGHRELAARTGAKIYVSRVAGATFPHVDVNDAYTLQVGRLRIEALATPGHTPESICLLVTDQERRDQPSAVLTGDTLFIGDVGRPDLSVTHTPVQLAGMLHDSLHQKLMTLPDDVLVYPAHGAGSLCGRNMRAERFSTITTERMTNYALHIHPREEFVRQITSNLPPRPDYFVEDAAINRKGAPALSELPTLEPVQPQELRSILENGGMALDIRTADQFVLGHVPASICIPLQGQFAPWAGAVLGLASRPVLIADNPEQLGEARVRLARVGIDDVRGFLQSGLEGWQKSGFPLQQVPRITVQEVAARLDTLTVLDVRREDEVQAGHIASAEWHPLDRFGAVLPEISHDKPVAVHCKSGYRSLIACSLLQRAGYQHVIDVVGGFDAWQAASLPAVSVTEAKAV
jgi:hydroxyacylglutathione hydrolase